MQEKLNKSHHKARNKIYNSKLSKLGNKAGLIVIDTTTLNLYRDKKYTPTEAKTITAYLDLPRDELELFGESGYGVPGFNIYDSLPKYMWCGLDVKISYDDFIMRQLYIDDTNFILQIFQITKTLIKGKTYLHQKRYLLAPVNVLEGTRGSDQMEMALSSLVADYRAEELPNEGTDIPVPDTTPDDTGFITNPDWYND